MKIWLIAIWKRRDYNKNNAQIRKIVINETVGDIHNKKSDTEFAGL